MIKNDHNPSTTNDSRQAFIFFILAVLLIVPFWILGTATHLALAPGIPISALGFVCPALAAAIMVYREDKWRSVKALLKRSFDYKRIKNWRWYVVVLLLFPAVMVMTYIILRLVGVNVPSPQIAIVPTIALIVIGFIAAMGEELGWSGYAIDRLQHRWHALPASIILGCMWSLYHYPVLLQLNRSISWMAWWTLYSVAARVIMVWIFNRDGKSVFSMALFHMMLNVAWQLFPINGSYADYRIISVLLVIIAVALYWSGKNRSPDATKMNA